MSALYQGRALHGPAPRRRPRRLRQLVALGTSLAIVAGLAVVPWGTLRRRFAVVTEVRVKGAQYLDVDRVAEVAGLEKGQDLFRVDRLRARQALLLEPRIAEAQVRRRWPRGLVIEVRERVPVMLVGHGVPWEIDSAGVLLEPLQDGVVADVPLLIGPRFDDLPAGAQLREGGVERGLAWMRALAERELQLAGQVSEIEVIDDETTSLTLMNGTRVLGPAWPPSRRRLSALRVVLVDLEHKQVEAEEVDLRYKDQVIVRPAAEPAATGQG